MGAAPAQAGRTEGNSVDWRTARCAADATTARRDTCERCDRQQYCPNAQGRVARETRARLSDGGGKPQVVQKSNRARRSGCEGLFCTTCGLGGGPKAGRARGSPCGAAGAAGPANKYRPYNEQSEDSFGQACRRPNDCRIDCNTASHGDARRAARALRRLWIGLSTHVPPSGAATAARR